jgi:peptide/nickel transport system permease protein
MFKAGITILSVFFLIALIGPVIYPVDPSEQHLDLRLSSPDNIHLLGTDELGRDVLSRLIFGSRVSMSVGFISVSISLLIGVPLGLLAGYHGGLVDKIIMRLVDIMLCFPSIFLILMVITFLGPSIYNVMVVIGISSWPGLTRYVRAETLAIREREFMMAAKVMGYSKFRVMFIHLLPNVVAPVLISATIGIGSAILTESVLSFLGLGVQPPSPSWGNILSAGRDYMGQNVWWLLFYPTLFILLTVLAFNMLGEGLRDMLDPRVRN